MDGWVRLHRVLIEKPIWKCSTPQQKAILITILLMVNHEEKEWEWQGKKFKTVPGQTITSLENIAKETGKGITIQNVRTAIDRFQKFGFLTNQSTKTGRLITIVNWELYQSKKENQQSSKQRPNKEVTTNKNDKNDKNIIYINIVEYLNEKTGSNYSPSTKSTQSLINGRLKEGHTVEEFKAVIDKKVVEWNHEPKPGEKDMREYLRPQTLFGTKFESYLNQKEAKAGTYQQKSPGNPNNRFNDFPQRKYTPDQYAEIERKLLNKTL